MPGTGNSCLQEEHVCAKSHLHHSISFPSAIADMCFLMSLTGLVSQFRSEMFFPGSLPLCQHAFNIMQLDSPFPPSNAGYVVRQFPGESLSKDSGAKICTDK